MAAFPNWLPERFLCADQEQELIASSARVIIATEKSTSRAVTLAIRSPILIVCRFRILQHLLRSLARSTSTNAFRTLASLQNINLHCTGSK